MQRAAEPFALHTANPADRIALRGVRLRSRLSGMSQRTTIEQTFVNAEPRAIEAVYTFPLPESAAVCGFEVVTGDRVLTGRIEEAEQAVEQYDEAVSEGHGAFMMEQDRPDVFTVRVGNLKPRQAATIRLTYVCPLEKADRSIRVAFPTTVAPRFVPPDAADPLEAMLEGDAVNPPQVLHVPYGLSMEVEIDLGRELTAVASPSHGIRVDRTEAGTTVVTLAGGITEMNRDVVLTLQLAKEHEPRVQVARGGAGGESYLAVTFLPEFDADELVDPPPAETVFVLDCSGSMQGDSIHQATAALELCLRSLSPGDTFNVCRFGSTFDLLASEPLPYSQATLDRALRYVREAPDLGGTELMPALQAILTTRPASGVVRQVVLLTDGQVSNEGAVIDLARQHRAHNRVFSFGIGAACSAHLVNGVARATGGVAEFITEGERIDDKVLRTFSRLASLMVSDVAIDWDGAEVQTLAELPPVFDGDVMAVFGRAAGRLPRKVTLSCTTPAGLRRWSLAVPTWPSDDGGVIATMWARRTIQSLEEVNGQQATRSRRSEHTREQEVMVNLSKEFNLLCSLTTFIAVEHRSVEERNEGRPELRRVPVQLAKGWGGVETALFGAVFDRAAPGAPPSALCSAVPADAGTGMFDLCADQDVLDECLSPAPPPPLQAPAAAPRPAAKARRRGVMISLRKLAGLGEPAKSPQEIKDELARKFPKSGMYSGGGSFRHSTRSPLPPPPPGALPPGIDRSYASRGEGVGGSDADGVDLGGRSVDGAPRDDLHDLLSLQAADGWFGWDEHAERLLSESDKASWRSTVGAALPPLAAGANREEVINTVLALLLLADRFADRQSLWQRAHRKASRQFLAKALGRPATAAEQWLTELRARL